MLRRARGGQEANERPNRRTSKVICRDQFAPRAKIFVQFHNQDMEAKDRNIKPDSELKEKLTKFCSTKNPLKAASNS